MKTQPESKDQNEEKKGVFMKGFLIFAACAFALILATAYSIAPGRRHSKSDSAKQARVAADHFQHDYSLYPSKWTRATRPAWVDDPDLFQRHGNGWSKDIRESKDKHGNEFKMLSWGDLHYTFERRHGGTYHLETCSYGDVKKLRKSDEGDCDHDLMLIEESIEIREKQEHPDPPDPLGAPPSPGVTSAERLDYKPSVKWEIPPWADDPDVFESKVGPAERETLMAGDQVELALRYPKILYSFIYRRPIGSLDYALVRCEKGHSPETKVEVVSCGPMLHIFNRLDVISKLK